MSEPRLHADGRGQRHARLVLGRGPLPGPAGRGRARGASSRPRARRSSTSAASRRGPGAEAVPADEELAAGAPGDRGAARRRRAGADLDRHLQGRGRGGGAAGGRDAGQRRHRAARRPRRWPRWSPPAGAELLPDAHARRAAHDAASIRATRTWSTRSRRSWRSGSPSPWRRESPRSGSCSIRASASARRSSTTSSCWRGSTSWWRSGGRWSSAPRASRFWDGSPGRPVDQRLAGNDRHLRRRLRARRPGVPGPRGGPDRRRAERGGCYGRSVDDEADEYDEVDEGREPGAPRARGHDRDQRPLALHPRRRQRGRAGDRPAAAARPADRRRRGRRHGDRPDRGHGRLQQGLPDGQPGRPAAHLQDARAAVRGDRRPGDRGVTAPMRCGSRRPSPSRRWRCPVSEVSVEVWRESQ